MIRPSTASPRNSRRSLESLPGFSAHHDRWTSADASTSGVSRVTPRRSASSGSRGTGSGMMRASEPGEDVVDRVPHGLDVLEVFVLDAEAHTALAQLLLEGLGQLDQGQRVGLEVIGERVTLVDRGGLDLQDVGQPVADEVEDLLAIHGTALDVGLGGHAGLLLVSGEDVGQCIDVLLCALVNRSGSAGGAQPAATAARSRSTTSASTISVATRQALTMAVADDD